jgi:site-specific DNA-methyltransferase (adenine-specific)
MKTNKIYQGNSLEVLKKLPDESVNCVMTSPPYWALRDYGTEGMIWDGDKNCEHDFEIKQRQLHSGTIDLNKTVHSALVRGGLKTDWKTSDGFCSKCNAWKGSLGLEPTFDLYIKHLCDIFDEVQRVLRKDGTCWVNMGDSYYGSGKGIGTDIDKSKEVYQMPSGWERPSREAFKQAGIKGKCLICNKECYGDFCSRECLNKKGNDFRSQNRILPDKCLCNIPNRFAIEMCNRGWILRNTIIWHKPNCMPSSVKDRFTVDFEYIFFSTKNKKYFFETQYDPLSLSYANDKRPMGVLRQSMYPNSKYVKYGMVQLNMGRELIKGNPNIGQQQNHSGNITSQTKGKNKRTVWSICPKGFKEAHFAIYPEALCETPLKSGCPEFVCNKCGEPREKIIEKGELSCSREIREDTLNMIPGRNKLSRLNSKRMESLPKRELGLTDCGCNMGFSSGIVLDPFFGAGTTGLVALKQGKKFIGIELNKKYIRIANKRLKPYLPIKTRGASAPSMNGGTK